MIKNVFLLAALSLCLFQSCDNDDNEPVPGYVSAETKAAFDEKYPAAKDVEWETRNDYLIVDFKQDKVEKEAWFDAKANWLMTETELNSINNLPPAVLTAFMESSYSNWVVDDVAILEYPNEPSTEFVVTVEQGKKVELYFSEGGGLLHEKDVTNGDDTHWPRV